MEDIKKFKSELFQRDYSEALQLARHHDTLIWLVTPILLSGLLLGLKDNLQIMPLIIGILITLFLIYIIWDFRRYKKYHYERANKILKKMRKWANSQNDEDELFEQPKGGCQWIVFIFIIVIIWTIVLASNFNLICL